MGIPTRYIQQTTVQYRLPLHSNSTILHKEVTAYLENGWELHGPALVIPPSAGYGIRFAQAVVLRVNTAEGAQDAL